MNVRIPGEITYQVPKFTAALRSYVFTEIEAPAAMLSMLLCGSGQLGTRVFDEPTFKESGVTLEDLGMQVQMAGRTENDPHIAIFALRIACEVHHSRSRGIDVGGGCLPRILAEDVY
jgi:hypothetical protein